MSLSTAASFEYGFPYFHLSNESSTPMIYELIIHFGVLWKELLSIKVNSSSRSSSSSLKKHQQDNTKDDDDNNKINTDDEIKLVPDKLKEKIKKIKRVSYKIQYKLHQYSSSKQQEQQQVEDLLWKDSCGDTILHRLCQISRFVPSSSSSSSNNHDFYNATTVKIISKVLLDIGKAIVKACPSLVVETNKWNETPLHQFVEHCGLLPNNSNLRRCAILNYCSSSAIGTSPSQQKVLATIPTNNNSAITTSEETSAAVHRNGDNINSNGADSSNKKSPVTTSTKTTAATSSSSPVAVTSNNKQNLDIVMEFVRLLTAATTTVEIPSKNHSQSLPSTTTTTTTTTKPISPVTIRNYLGLLPLHVACILQHGQILSSSSSSSNNDNDDNNSIRRLLEIQKIQHLGIINHLIHCLPSSLFVTDYSKQYMPIHYSVMSNNCSKDVVCLLLRNIEKHVVTVMPPMPSTTLGNNTNKNNDNKRRRSTYLKDLIISGCNMYIASSNKNSSRSSDNDNTNLESLLALLYQQYCSFWEFNYSINNSNSAANSTSSDNNTNKTLSMIIIDTLLRRRLKQEGQQKHDNRNTGEGGTDDDDNDDDVQDNTMNANDDELSSLINQVLGSSWEKMLLLFNTAYYGTTTTTATAITANNSSSSNNNNDKNSTLILHAALSVGCPLLCVFHLLVELYPEQLLTKDCNGNTPLALALSIHNGTSTAKPSFTPYGTTKFHHNNNNSSNANNRYRHERTNRHRHQSTEYWLPTDQQRTISKLIKLFLLSSSNSQTEAAASAHMTSEFCKSSTITKDIHTTVVKNVAAIPNKLGQLPLHIALSQTKIYGSSSNDNDYMRQQQQQQQRSLRQHNLSYYSLNWNEDIELIFNSNPSALRMKDPVTHLYPFLLAATSALNVSSPFVSSPEQISPSKEKEKVVAIESNNNGDDNDDDNNDDEDVYDDTITLQNEELQSMIQQDVKQLNVIFELLKGDPTVLLFHF